MTSCTHPPERLHAWFAHDGVLCVACNECGAVLQGGVDGPAWPSPTMAQPSIEELIEFEEEGGCEATDGCWTDPDGTCPHGHPSWLLVLGMI